MFGRILGVIVASIFTAACVLGISVLIASDFSSLGEHWIKFKSWYATPAPKTSLLGKSEALKDAENITFFSTQPIEGSKLKVSTGIAFATAEDILAGKTSNRWCYIQSSSGNFTNRIDLGSQKGGEDPQYVDTSVYTKEQLSEFGFSAEHLASLARSHCLLEGFDPRARDVPKPKASENLRQRQTPKNAPARVWNWKKPYLPPRVTKKRQQAFVGLPEHLDLHIPGIRQSAIAVVIPPDKRPPKLPDPHSLVS